MPRGQRKGFKHTEKSKAKIRAGVHRAAANGGAWVASAKTRAQPYEVCALRVRMTTYKCAAARTKRCWELTEEDFKAITARPCWYCGDAPNQEAWKYPGPKFNGIDRVDNSIGYVPSNVVACCAICNRAKHTMLKDDFIALAKRIARKHQ